MNRIKSSFTMNTFSLLIEVLYISSHIPRAFGRSEDVPLSPTKPDPSDAQILESFDIYPSEKVHWADCSTNNSNRIQTTSGEPDEAYRWKNGFFVQPDKAFDENEVKLINSAMYDLQQVLCIPVKVWPQDSIPKGDYAFIKKGFNEYAYTCSSVVGRQGGKQIITIGSQGCVYKDVIIHEIIHALGFDHEQNRPDRDDYVDIHWEHIYPGMGYNFELATGSLTFDVPYDYDSIMHYSSYALSKDGKPTILKKDGTEIGRNSEISAYDVKKLKAMYNCE